MYLGHQRLTATVSLLTERFTHIVFGSGQECLKYVKTTHTDLPPHVPLAVWTAVMWATTAMRPTLAAFPACPTAHHLSPGATVSPALVFKRATLRPPQVEGTRAVRAAPSTRLTRCQLAAPAASAARLASSSSKGWTTPT